jgi:hypothetical protein
MNMNSTVELCRLKYSTNEMSDIQIMFNRYIGRETHLSLEDAGDDSYLAIL